MATRERTGKQPQKKTASGKPGAGGATRTAGKPKTGTRGKSGTGKSASGKPKRALATQVSPMGPLPGMEPTILPETAPLAHGTDKPETGLGMSDPSPAVKGDTAEIASACLAGDEAGPVLAPVDAAPEPVSSPPSPPLAPGDEAGLPPPASTRETRPPMPTEADIAAAAREKTPEAATSTAAADGGVPPAVAVVTDIPEAPTGVVDVPEATQLVTDIPLAAPPAVEPTAEDQTREGEAQLVASYLAGALEGLAGQVVSPTAVRLDPALADLALEKLQYFGQALHLLAEAVDFVDMHKIGHGKAETPPRLRVRLESRAAGRLALRCFDDGRFFERALPKLRLDMEALRPLVLAVTRAGGSICLRRGRCVEVEITG